MSTTPEYDQDGRIITPGNNDRSQQEASTAAYGTENVTNTAGTSAAETTARHPTTPLPENVFRSAPTGNAAPLSQEFHANTQYPYGATPQSAGSADPHAQTAAFQQQPHQQFAYGAPAQEGAQPAHNAGHGSFLPPAGPTTDQRSGASGGKNRTGALLAGLAIGALLGGVTGGGVAAVVSANADQTSTASSDGSGAITLNNAENATAISGVAAVATPSVVTLEVAGASASGSGSGVIYREDGYIITNAHVVTLDGAAMSDAKIRVKLSDGRIFAGELVNVDPYSDLAVVKIDATDLPAVKVADSDKIDVGDLTVAIGAPLNLANTVTSGVVSALNRGISVGSPLIEGDQGQDDDGGNGGDGGGGFPWDFRFGLPDEQGQQGQQQEPSTSGTVTLPVIQTDASINPGNSGGALLNGNGELIGINVAIASTSTSGETAGSVGLGFAIPANLVTRVADAIIDGEQPSHGLLGASVADSSQDTDEDANHAGGLLVDVSKGGAADKAGLRAGDVITAIDGVAAVDGTSVSALIRGHAGGSTVKISYTRGGEAGETEATLGTLEW
ncbi:S1C family serine protease [Leucobacter sp. USHLN153]|uniref:S1C family serine protease n=1 Tax=Leucobacter sp. USHLN153 TaxID=3081268 RepID=UPI003018226C